MKKLRFLLAFFSFMLLPFFDLTAHAQTTDDVEIILHKIVFPENQLPNEQENDGTTSGSHADLLKEYRGLDGVTFDVYDVTKTFYNLRDSGKSVEESQKIIASQENYEQFIERQITQTIGNEVGVAKFTLPLQTQDKQDSVYVFKEIQAPAHIKEKAKNLVVVLPVLDSLQKQMTTIHLYPKNEEVAHKEPEVTKKDITNEKSYTYGDIIHYQAAISIPEDILDYSYFKIKDEAQASLRLDKASIQLRMGDQLIPDTQYKLKTSTQGFELDFLSMAYLDSHQDQGITIDYDMTLVEDPLSHEVAKNELMLRTDFETLTRETREAYGGKKFRKIGINQGDGGLKGAKFLVVNDQKQILIQTPSGYDWSNDLEDDNRLILVSGELGAFSINGLSYGNYFLREIQAPEGYVANAEDIAFTVTKGSYSEESDVLEIVNKPKTPQTKPPTGPGHLPQTGEKNNRLILMGGIFILLGTIVLYKKVGIKK